MANTDPRTVKLKRVRLAFTESLHTKKKTSDDPNAVPKHSHNVILEKGQPFYEENVALCLGAVEAACEAEWKNKDRWKSIYEDNKQRVCFRPGETFKNKETGVVYNGYEGNKAIACGTPGAGQRRPKLLDRHKRPVAEADILDVMAPGYYADVIIAFYGTMKGSAGVFCTTEVIRSHQEGELFGGGGWNGDVDEEFEDLPDDAFDGVTSGEKSDSPFG